MDVRPIRTETDYTDALREIDRLWGAAVGSAEGDKLEVLATLVEAYDRKNVPIEPADPIDVLAYAISDLGRSQKDLAELLGSRSRASEILARKRPMTLDQIRKISEAWSIPIAVLAQRYQTTEAA